MKKEKAQKEFPGFPKRSDLAEKAYVAGPYSSNTTVGTLDNIRRGIKACAWLVKQGYNVICPWLDYQYHFFEPGLKVSDYQRNSIAWLKFCDLLFVLPGWEKSKGTLAEIELAKRLKINILYAKQAWE